MTSKKACRTICQKFGLAKNCSQSDLNDLKWFEMFTKGLKESQLCFWLPDFASSSWDARDKKWNFSFKMMVILDLINGQNSPKFPLFEKFVDLISRPANMAWSAHAVSKCTLVGVTDLQSLGTCDLYLKSYSKIELGGGSKHPFRTPPHMNFRKYT